MNYTMQKTQRKIIKAKQKRKVDKTLWEKPIL